MAMRIQTILVPTDFSSNAQVAVEKGCELALELAAKLYLLHVQDESTLRTAIKKGLLTKESSDEDLQAKVKQLIHAGFSDALSKVNDSKVAVEYLSRCAEIRRRS